MNQSEGTRLSRDVPVELGKTALLLIDVQNFSARPDGGEYKAQGLTPEQAYEKHRYFFDTVRNVALPNIRALQQACREVGVEVMYTVIENLTLDGRDRSLDYKQTGFHFPPGSRETEVCDEVAPAPDEIVLPKTSSSLFNSTVFEYVLRNIGLDTVIVTGFLTDQCVDHTIRDGADRGFRMICATDACTTDTRERHENALAAFRGYCRQAATDELVAELMAATGR